jgi:two-component system chemotaxis response regulator CheB
LKNYTLKKPKPKKQIKRSNKGNIDINSDKKIHPDEVYPSNPAIFQGSKIIAIGSSTGGVESLLNVFKKLPSGLPPIVIVQHIPYGFSSSFAQRLDDYSDVKVQEVEYDNMVLENSHAYLAPGNKHLIIEKNGNKYVTKLLDICKVTRHKPSVNMLFRSVNNCAGGGAMAVMMTGMGDDGALAMKELHDNNAYCVAQNEETCVVFGMPQQAIKLGAVDDIVSLDDIASYIVKFSSKK